MKGALQALYAPSPLRSQLPQCRPTTPSFLLLKREAPASLFSFPLKAPGGFFLPLWLPSPNWAFGFCLRNKNFQGWIPNGPFCINEPFKHTAVLSHQNTLVQLEKLNKQIKTTIIKAYRGRKGLPSPLFSWVLGSFSHWNKNPGPVSIWFRWLQGWSYAAFSVIYSPSGRLLLLEGSKGRGSSTLHASFYS